MDHLLVHKVPNRRVRHRDEVVEGRSQLVSDNDRVRASAECVGRAAAQSELLLTSSPRERKVSSTVPRRLRSSRWLDVDRGVR
jgi:hypothetical protein